MAWEVSWAISFSGSPSRWQVMVRWSVIKLAAPELQHGTSNVTTEGKLWSFELVEMKRKTLKEGKIFH